MISFDLVWLFLIIGLVGCFGVTTVISAISFSKKEKCDCFLRTFPYEVASKDAPLGNLYRPFLYVYSGLCFGPLFDIVPNSDKFGNMLILPIVVSCVFGFMGLVVSALHIFEAKYPKTHMIVATLQIAFTILGSMLSCLFGILTYKVNNDFGEAKISTLILSILSGLIAIAVLVISLNPKLKDWAKLESIKNDDGSITYKRPKVFPLAFTEWLVMWLGVLAEVVFFVTLLK